MMVFDVQPLLVLILVTWSSVACQQEGPFCLSCDQVDHPERCSIVRQCAPSQICYSQKYLNSNGNMYYKLGCLDRNTCLSFGYNGVSGVFGKRHKRKVTNDDVIASRYDVMGSVEKRASQTGTQANICTECCGTRVCNRELCGANATPDTRPCFHCDNVIDPHDCQQIQMCGSRYQCFIHQIAINVDETRYSLGCLPERQCDGVMHAYNNLGCAKCCSDPYCNLFACDASYNTSTATTTTTTPTTTKITVPTSPAPLEIQGQTAAPSNNNLFLRCSDQSHTGTYTWTFNSSMHLPSNVITSNGQLFINHLDSQSQGVYGCTKVYPDGSMQHASHTVMIELDNTSTATTTTTTPTTTKITVPKRPAPLEIQGQTAAPSNNNLFLRCSDQSHTGTYTWTFNSSMHLPSNVITSNGQLFINHLNSQSQGVYGCTKVYPDGSMQHASHTVMIELVSAP